MMQKSRQPQSADSLRSIWARAFCVQKPRDWRCWPRLQRAGKGGTSPAPAKILAVAAPNPLEAPVTNTIMTQSVLVSIPQTAANSRRDDVKGGEYGQAGFFDHPKIFTSGTVLPAKATGNVCAALTSDQRAIVRNFAANACIITPPLLPYVFFFNATATTKIYTLSLHDALPI